ncbi:MAG: hypothetical protein IPQ08_04490 [Chitinophagaceae bacterium]|nr:hypothetical protein [Chitinophagaceae bacterium]
MKAMFFLFAAALIISGLTSCGTSSGKPQSFCDTVCIKDSIHFKGSHPLKPEVILLPQDCGIDSILWTYDGMGFYRKVDLGYSNVKLNPAFISCLFRDTSYAFLLFNDCITGRGYQVKIPITKSGSYSKRSSGINSFDKKFSVEEGMLAYTDRGNIYVEEIATGRQAMMTFGQATELDYDAIHDILDSVKVTRDNIYVRIRLNDKWEELQKKIKLELP